MSFWVYGRDNDTGEADRFFSEAPTEEAARAEATAQGMVVERVEPNAKEHSGGTQTVAFTPPANTASSPKRCINCGVPVSPSAEYCPECGTLLPDRNHVATTSPKPAGFWIRVVASLIDGLVLVLPLGRAGIAALSAKSWPLLIVVSIPGFIYKPFMESYYGATLGKMACGLRVMD